MITVGITGGLGTGKSSVTRLLGEMGAITFSADEAARAILTPGGPTLRQIEAAFGPEVLHRDVSGGGQRLNRQYLAARIFGDTTARATLDAITHPPILRLLRAQIEACAVDLPPATIVAVEVPLLFETGIQNWFERIVVVATSESVQVSRLVARSRLDPGEARHRIAAQMPIERKVELADTVISNNGDRDALRQAVVVLWRELRRESETVKNFTESSKPGLTNPKSACFPWGVML